MRVAITGGGTGGHAFPALAVARKLKALGVEIAWFGKRGSIEERLSMEEGIPFFAVPTGKWTGQRKLARVVSLAKYALGTLRCAWLLARFRPSCLFATGGYASVPAVLASLVLGIPVFLHEQNVVPGQATLLFSRFVRCLLTSFEETAFLVRYPEKAKVTGNPIRQEALAKPKKRSHFLIIGGSQGALALVKIAPQVLRLARAKGRGLVVIAGRFADSLRGSLRGARVEGFVKNVGDVYRDTIVALARAGAGTTFELAVNGVPAVLVPFRYAAGHQMRNAKAWEERETAVAIEENTDVDRLLYLLDLISVRKVKLRGLGKKNRRRLAGAVDKICRTLTSQN